MKKQSKISVPKYPSPAELMAKADKLADGFNLSDYRSVIFKLRHKGLTFRAIAEWLTKELGRPITHTQVYRLLQVSDEPPSSEESDILLSRELEAEDELHSKGGQS